MKMFPGSTWEIPVVYSFHPVSCFLHLPVSSFSSKIKKQYKSRKEIMFQGGNKISLPVSVFFLKVTCRQLVPLKLRFIYEKYSANKLGSSLLLKPTWDSMILICFTNSILCLQEFCMVMRCCRSSSVFVLKQFRVQGKTS